MLGHKSVRAAKRAIDPLEFVVWQAAFNLRLFEQAEDVRHAELMMLLANAYRDRKRHPQPFRVAEFMPQVGTAPEEPDLAAKIMAMNEALGGTVVVH